MSNWITVEQLDQAVIDWAQKFEDRVVRPMLDGEWAHPTAKHAVHWLFVEMRDRACEGDGKEVKRLATEILDRRNEQIARSQQHRDDQETGGSLLQRALKNGNGAT